MLSHYICVFFKRNLKDLYYYFTSLAELFDLYLGTFQPASLLY